MAEVYASNGKANTGVALGAVGTGLALLNGGLGGILGGWGLNGANARVAAATGCGCSEDHLVDRYTLGLEQENSTLKTQIALRDANTYTDGKIIDTYKELRGLIGDLQEVVAGQAVKNQATSDSFRMVEDRINCVQRELSGAICRESDERKCNDRLLVNYMNATFYPKQVADVTVGTATTAQLVYNPLPACDCDC